MLIGKFNIIRPIINAHADYNFSYYPIILTSEKVLLNLQQKLNKQKIFPRRYFYPSLNNLDYCKNQCAPISEDIANRILCLPLYYDLSEKNIRKIAEIIHQNL